MRGARTQTGDDMRETTAASGQGTDSTDEQAWFTPAGEAIGERNRHRLRGWAIAVSSALVLWGVIALVVWALASLFA